MEQIESFWNPNLGYFLNKLDLDTKSRKKSRQNNEKDYGL